MRHSFVTPFFNGNSFVIHMLGLKIDESMSWWHFYFLLIYFLAVSIHIARLIMGGGV